MVQDVLDELLQTEKAAADLVARAEQAAARRAQDADQQIQRLQAELKQELKQKRLEQKAELEAEYAKAAALAQKKTGAKLEKLKLDRAELSGAADYLAQKILA
ncbi:MAG: hypothetical protein LBQ83_04915 [Candidatus Margulisbacteria bacterium]|jgi:hypothetical protein|nr:hypothetical protein [Candidatus Margulisiibacteriota bacterium]